MLADPEATTRARPLSLFRRWLSDQRRSTLAWASGLFGILAVQLSVYPAMKSQTGLNDIWDKMPQAMQAMFGVSGGLDFTSGTGYLHGEVFGFTLPLLFLVFGIGAGTAAIAGDEEKGTLTLVVAQPVRRAQIVVERFGALLCRAGLLAGTVLVTLIAGGVLVGMHVAISALAAAVAATMLLSVLFAAVALAAGAATGRRSSALAISAGAAVASYLSDSLAAVADVMKPLQFFSPMHWASPGALVAGHSATGLAWLLVATLGCVAAGALAFERRDLR